MLKTKNSERFAIGMEYNPFNTRKNLKMKRFSLRAGANYNSSYMEINNVPIVTKALTFGAGIPLRKELTLINLSFEYGENGTLKNNLIKENYFLMHINITLHDLWFIKPKYD
jgi:hypothetical protein